MKTSYETFQESLRRRGKGGHTVFGIELTHNQIFVATYITGVLTFLLVLLLMSTAFYRHAYVVTPLVLIGLCFSLFAWNTNKTLLHKPMASASIFALVLGFAWGLFIYDSSGYFAFIYSSSRTYRNVVVSQPAASVADAGHVLFAPETYVDQTKAVGYAADDGVRYCVAPLRDLVDTTRVEFWAVGYDCCEWQGGFKCDAAANADARGGIVVFEGAGYFMESNFDYYTLARKKAEAMFGLQSCDKPIYVRWVKSGDLDKLQTHYEWRTALVITISFIIYAIASFLPIRSYCKQNHDQFLGLV
jgi:hypothetical protein